MTVETADADDLQAIIDDVLSRYPWFVDYRSCHDSCARWRITEEHDKTTGRAWERYSSALWLLMGRSAHRP